MNIKEIQQLIKFVSKSGVSEVKIESKDLKISVKTGKNPTVIQNEPVLVSQQPIAQTVPTTFEQNEPIIPMNLPLMKTIILLQSSLLLSEHFTENHRQISLILLKLEIVSAKEAYCV